MKEFCAIVDELIDYAKKNLGLKPRNEIYARNTVLGILGVKTYEGTGATTDDETPDTLLNRLMDALSGQGLSAEEVALKMDAVMGALSLLPSEVDDTFAALKADDSAKATEWLYRYLVKNGNIKKSISDQNPRKETNGLFVTVQKTEETEKESVLSTLNEGVFGENGRTLRLASLTLNGKEFVWQFKPFSYCRQCGVAFPKDGSFVSLNEETFYEMIDFVDQFPHYFVGLDPVSEKHFVAGAELLPLLKAKGKEMSEAPVEGVKVCFLDWPSTVIRVKGSDRSKVAFVADCIRKSWTTYENKETGLLPVDEKGMHSFVTPILIKTWEGYEMNLVLRNDVSSETYPEGVFKVHSTYRMIREEAIGLKEEAGLFVMKESLLGTLSKVSECVRKGELSEELSAFSLVYDELRVRLEPNPDQELDGILNEEIGSLLIRVLSDTAVLKTAEEEKAFLSGVIYA